MTERDDVHIGVCPCVYVKCSQKHYRNLFTDVEQANDSGLDAELQLLTQLISDKDNSDRIANNDCSGLAQDLRR